MSSTGLLKLVRKPDVGDGFGYGLQTFDVLIDGKKIGSIAKGKNEENFDIATGRHTVQVLTISGVNGRSEMLEIDIEPNNPLELECGTSRRLPKRSRLFWLLLLFFFSVFLRWNPHFFPSIIGATGSYIIGTVIFVGIAILYFRARYSGAPYYIKRLDTTPPTS